ncbi:hypothetical protein DFH06DRAFT_1321143 [Mycena polygramma]|nr:hypothetical protein DFH06DRAFT_1321143 [Mycena polygramma]
MAVPLFPARSESEARRCRRPSDVVVEDASNSVLATEQATDIAQRSPVWSSSGPHTSRFPDCTTFKRALLHSSYRSEGLDTKAAFVPFIFLYLLILSRPLSTHPCLKCAPQRPKGGNR